MTAQRRFVLAVFPDYERAKAAKEIFVKENPDTNYQIRRKRGDNFAVVKRVQTAEPNPTTKSTKRPQKYRMFTGETDA